ncbi:MAG: hypothetical protein ACYDAR_20880 [Thermomicrobiales bacterium]
MMYDTDESRVLEHPELIDMRTHLTVAMLAASQLTRKTQHLPEAAHLQEYLDQSLKSLVADVGRVDALVTQAEECTATAQTATVQRRIPRSLRWGVALLQRATRGVCGRLHRTHAARLTMTYLYR